jgi:hypothetical protein
MSLRVLLLAVAALALVLGAGALGGAATPTAAPATVAPSPTTPPLPTLSPTIQLLTPPPAPTPLPSPPPYGTAVPRTPLAVPLTDSQILADVQSRVLAKLTAAPGKPPPAIVRLAGARTAARPPFADTPAIVSPEVARFAPDTLPAISPDTKGLNFPKGVELAVVVVHCGCDDVSAVLPKGPRGAVEYLILVYDPRYNAPVNTIWAPESDLVQALTGNRAVPTATLAPTQTTAQRNAMATQVARTVTPAASGAAAAGLAPMR